MLKFGNISEVDAQKGVARVKFDGESGMVSYWLPISLAGTVDNKFIIPFSVNEHVWCMMDENLEYGVIGGAIYDEKNIPEGDNKKVRVRFGEGLGIEYDHESKTLTIDGDGDLSIDINGTGKGKVDIKCNQAVIDSLTDVEIKSATQIKFEAPVITALGLLQAAAISTAPASGFDGNVEITGDVTVSGKVEADEVKEGSIRLGSHKHSGVQAGGGVSGAPIP